MINMISVEEGKRISTQSSDCFYNKKIRENGSDIDNLIFSYLDVPPGQLKKVSFQEQRWLLSLSAVTRSFRGNSVLTNLRNSILKIKSEKIQSAKNRAWIGFRFQATGAAAMIGWAGLACFVTEAVHNRFSLNVFPLFCAASVFIPLCFRRYAKIESDSDLLIKVFATALTSVSLSFLGQNSSQISVSISAYAPMLVSVICVSAINYLWKMNQINREN